MRNTVKTVFHVLLASSLLVAGSAWTAPAPAAASGQVGTLKYEVHGAQGRPVILIPGLEGGPWVWKDTIARLEKNHVVYAVTLAGFDGMPALRFAGEHAALISGAVAVDGLPIFPGMDRVDAAQRQAIAERTRTQMGALTPAQFQAAALGYMQHVGVIDPKLAEQYAPMNARSDIAATAEYMSEDMAADYRPLLKQADVPILEISPYNAPDFQAAAAMSKQPVMSEAQKTAYYQSLLADAPHAKVVSIAP